MEWFKHINDPQFDCAATNFGVEDAPIEQEISDQHIFKVVDCDQEGARWDFKFQVSSISAHESSKLNLANRSESVLLLTGQGLLCREEEGRRQEVDLLGTQRLGLRPTRRRTRIQAGAQVKHQVGMKWREASVISTLQVRKMCGTLTGVRRAGERWPQGRRLALHHRRLRRRRPGSRQPRNSRIL